MTGWALACCVLTGLVLVLATAWWGERRARKRLESRLDERETTVVRALRDTRAALTNATKAIQENTEALRR